MKKFVLLSFAIILATFSLYSQNTKVIIKATIKDSSGLVYPSATVVLFNIIDSSVVDTKITDEKGYFQFNGIENGIYRIFITSVQFQSFIKDLVIDSTTKNINLGNIVINKVKNEGQVTVVAQNPIRIAQDTIEFRADAFKTRPNAVVEDLLKKLPGVQVDKDGKITAQGQTVTKVFVDGKQFFGDDPKTATKNLPANIVDKVQVVDRKSDQSQFTGFDDGTTEKVINITIKKDKKKGFFGRGYLAGGTNERFEGNLNMNKFNNKVQMSLIAQANNTNNEGFTFQDIMDFNGNGGFNRSGDAGSGGTTMAITTTRGGGGMFGGTNISGPPTGLRTTKAGGINISAAFSNKFKMSSSYFVNNSYVNTVKSSSRQNFAVDTAFNNINNQTSNANNWNTNHRLNVEMDWIIDSFNSVLIRPNVTFIQKESESISNTNIVAMNKNPRNNIFQRNNSNAEQWNLSNTFLWKHKTRVKGRTLSIRLNNGANTTNGDGDNYNEQNAFVPFNSIKIIDQINNTDNKGNTLNARVSYTEPLSKTRIIELFYLYGRTKNDADKKTFRKDVLGKYSILDSTLSNIFENKNENQQLGFNIQTKLKKYDYSIGLAVQNANLTSINTLKNISIIQKNILNYFPTARLNFNLGKSRRLNFNYKGSTNQPNVTQLQPVFDNSNPISIKQGNPSLKQEFNNNVSLNYNKFDFITLKNIFAFFTFSTTRNKIIDSITNISPGQLIPGYNQPVTPGTQYRRPGNANGAYNVLGNVNYSFPIKAIKTTNVSTNTSAFYFKDISVIDKKNNFTKNLNLTESVSVNYNYKDNLDISLSSAITYNKSSYSLTPNSNNEYYNLTHSFDVSYSFKNDLTIQTDIDNNAYRGRSDGFNQNYTLWNGSISKLFLKSKALELKFTAYDILKQNRSITRTVQETYIEDANANVLSQYFLIGIKYNFNRFGGKGAKGFSMPKMPGTRQMNNLRIGM